MTHSFKQPGLWLAGFLVAVFMLPASLFAQDVERFLGDWKGGLSLDGEDFDIVLHFVLDAEGKIAGTLDSPSQEGFDFPMASIKVDGRTIQFTIPAAPRNPVLKGVLSDTGRKISGTIIQGEAEGIFQVEKVSRAMERTEAPPSLSLRAVRGEPVEKRLAEA